MFKLTQIQLHNIQIIILFIINKTRTDTVIQNSQKQLNNQHVCTIPTTHHEQTDYAAFLGMHQRQLKIETNDAQAFKHDNMFGEKMT